MLIDLEAVFAHTRDLSKTHAHKTAIPATYNVDLMENALIIRQIPGTHVWIVSDSAVDFTTSLLGQKM